MGVGVYNVVKVFFEGQTLPKSITHTILVLIPKKNNVETFTDMRPISLSNFINKLISRVVQNKLENVLPSLISTNQYGFVKGRCIIKNVLLTQKVVSDIRLKGKPANVVLKLDMAKAYDRVSWDFLARVRGRWDLRILPRALNSLFEDNGFRSYGMPKWSANLNHLAYANDTIIFSSADDTSLQLIMRILQEYEQMSGQLINKGKSSFYMHSKAANVIVQQVEAITGFTRGSFPFTYLGCLITHARKRKADYSDLIQKVKDKLAAWKGRLLSFGGKVVLINSVLVSMPIHLLSAIRPPKGVIYDLHRVFARFF
ncbi:uncharacterized protein LOC132048898 [Lycium ferocissimum]|uniref:uncharacterized protein LOC132048898 n=1 Tax=Lycium ferocissimum TaxID=112874 RepID=UPI002815AF18|nr:uncharacterized protein LOC132048898 [Lycium ferocissimum]